MEDRLTHIDENGRPRMVDVGEKADTKRLAVAKGSIYMHPETLTVSYTHLDVYKRQGLT